MAVILDNHPVADGVFMLTLSGVPLGRPGQFLNVHLPDEAHLLPRPISLYGIDEESGTTQLVYRVAGRGTALLATLKSGELRASGPLGNGFPLEKGDAVLIGGGLGIAPMHLLLQTLRHSDPARHIRVYLGFSDREFLKDAFFEADSLVTDVGGYVTDTVDFLNKATYYACGPTPMMAAAAAKARANDQRLYVSLEKRMACGVGACYACSVKTRSGNRRVCKDGPVFAAEEIYYDAV